MDHYCKLLVVGWSAVEGRARPHDDEGIVQGWVLPPNTRLLLYDLLAKFADVASVEVSLVE